MINLIFNVSNCTAKNYLLFNTVQYNTKLHRASQRQTVNTQINLGTLWWRHQMEPPSALMAICAGNSPVTGEFPAQRPVLRALMFSLICVWINGWINNGAADDLRLHRTHYDVSVMRRRHLITCLRSLATYRMSIMSMFFKARLQFIMTLDCIKNNKAEIWQH